jgi:hypothetical protein
VVKRELTFCLCFGDQETEALKLEEKALSLRSRLQRRMHHRQKRTRSAKMPLQMSKKKRKKKIRYTSCYSAQ